MWCDESMLRLDLRRRSAEDRGETSDDFAPCALKERRRRFLAVCFPVAFQRVYHYANCNPFSPTALLLSSSLPLPLSRTARTDAQSATVVRVFLYRAVNSVTQKLSSKQTTNICAHTCVLYILLLLSTCRRCIVF